jgi:hypothetical protein
MPDFGAFAGSMYERVKMIGWRGQKVLWGEMEVLATVYGI